MISKKDMTTIISIEDFFLRLNKYKPSKNLRNYDKTKFLEDCEEIRRFSYFDKYDFEALVELIGKLDYKQINYIIRRYKFDFYVDNPEYKELYKYQEELIKGIIKIYLKQVYPEKKN